MQGLQWFFFNWILSLFLFVGIGFSQISKFKSEFTSSRLESDNYSLMDSLPLDPSQNVYDFPIDPNEYILGPGDVLGLDIYSDVYFKLLLNVNPQGGVSIPEIGNISSIGKTIEEFEKVVFSKILTRHKVDSINLYLKSAKKNKLTVIGAVRRPGVVVLDAPSRLGDVLQKSIKLPNSRLDSILIFYEKNTKKVNYFEFFRTGSKEDNPIIPSGSMVKVNDCNSSDDFFYLVGQGRKARYCKPSNLKLSEVPIIIGSLYKLDEYGSKYIVKRNDKFITEFNSSEFVIEAKDTIILYSVETKIFVSGMVSAPGEYEYSPSLTIAQYISIAGGETWQGNQKGFNLIRDGKDIKLNNTEKPLPGDIIFIPGRKIIRISEFMSVLVGFATLIISAKAIGLF